MGAAEGVVSGRKELEVAMQLCGRPTPALPGLQRRDLVASARVSFLTCTVTLTHIVLALVRQAYPRILGAKAVLLPEPDMSED